MSRSATTTRRILLVYPRNARAHWRGASRLMKSILGKDSVFLSATLPTIAALTPPEFEIDIVDELLSPIDPGRKYDLVGIASAATELLRAKELAREMRARGSLVVIGGASVSTGPQRWREVGDVLILGEAERIWPKFLADYLSGRHAPEYRESERFDLSESPVPDYRPIPREIRARYSSGLVQTSRGCRFRCDFCAVGPYLGNRLRYKTADRVVAEVEQLYGMGLRSVFLADDNFSGDRDKAKAILEGLREFNRRQRHPVVFNTQIAIDVADDDELLELAAEAGLTRVLIGIDAITPESLRDAKKAPNIGRDVVADLTKIHRHGILTVAGMIVGFDHDDLSTFGKHFEFCQGQGLPIIQVAALQALDGTTLKERMVREGRYVDWDRACLVDPKDASSFNTFTMVPDRMTVPQLQQGVLWLLWNLCRLDHVAARLDRFFADYESGPRSMRPAGGSLWPDPGKLGAALRFLRYVALETDGGERRALLGMLGRALSSSHPQRMEIALFSFLSARATQEVLLAEMPTISRIECPREPEAASPTGPGAIGR
ncbi:MAG: B12-binding domain-containing radical SAM protein [Candidatus Riflebacteria bacterium]|nr:B12-binding domain-containing radical SAM protein [Candidatus Riflebacteria bacterium]